VFIGAPCLGSCSRVSLPVTDVLKKNRGEGRRNLVFSQKKCGLNTKMPFGAGDFVRAKVIPPDNARRAASAMVGEISENFEVRREYFVVLALQQALERLHYRDFSCGRTKCDLNPSTRSNNY